jgi:hypothetical protein
MRRAVPLAHQTVRLWALQALCAVAEGARVVAASDAADAVSAALNDAQQRVAVLGGRKGMPRSIGSLYGGLIVLFVGTDFRGEAERGVVPGTLADIFDSIAVTRDGLTLLAVGHTYSDEDFMYVYRIADGELIRVLGESGDGPLQFRGPRDISVAADGGVFVAECSNQRVQELTPSLGFQRFIGVGHLEIPRSVCADEEHVAVSSNRHIWVFARRDAVLLRRFESFVEGTPQLMNLKQVRFVTGGRHVVVAGYGRLNLFTISGDFVCCFGTGHHTDVACSDFGEIIAINRRGEDNTCVYWLDGTLLRVIPATRRQFAVTLHDSRVFVSHLYCPKIREMK